MTTQNVKLNKTVFKVRLSVVRKALYTFLHHKNHKKIVLK